MLSLLYRQALPIPAGSTLIPVTTEPEIVIVDGYYIDADTGEVLGLVGQPTPWQPETLADAEWVMDKFQRADAEKLAIQARRAAIFEQLEAQEREVDGRRAYLESRFGAALQAIARRELSTAKIKTLKTTFGNLSFRIAPGSIKVLDTAKAVAWLRAVGLSEAVKVTETVLVTPLKDETDLPEDLFEIKAPEERFSIATGIKAK